MNTPESYAYRIAALLSPGATVVGLATLATSDGGTAVTGPEVVMSLVVTITAWAAHAGVQALPEVTARGFRHQASGRASTSV